MKKGSIMKEYLQFIKRYHVVFPMLLLFGCMGFMKIISPIESSIFGKLLAQFGTDGSRYLIFQILLMEFAALFVAILNRVTRVRVSAHLTKRYQDDIYSKVISLSVENLETFSIPKLTTAIQSTIDTAMDCINIPLWLFSVIVTSVSTFVVLFNTDKVLTLIIMSFSFPLLILNLKVQKNLDGFTECKRRQSATMNTIISRLEGYLTIKSFGKEKFEKDSFYKSSTKLEEVLIQRGSLLNKCNYISYLTWILVVIATIVYISLTADGNIQEAVSKGFVFWNLGEMMFAPFEDLPGILSSFSEIKTHLKENQKILDLPSEADGTVEVDTFEDSIRVENCTFRYNESTPLFNDINFTIKKGEKVGIYGASGSGKSTIVNLINRFIRVKGGKILIDGIDINEISNKSLRKLIGNVNQEVFMFSDMSIRDNIKYGINCTDYEMVEAAKAANAHEFISKLENGYDSMIGNNGVLLSGGERQRIALARLFLLNPPILILDEATSKLDNENERAIKESIERLSKDKTVISIAHRLSTIEDYDVLMGIKDHKIYESGPAENIKRTGELWNSLSKYNQ